MPSIAKWIRNLSSLWYLYTQVIGEQQKTSLGIDTGSDWNLSRVPSVICEIGTCLLDAVLVWQKEKYPHSSRNLVTYILSVCVSFWWVRIMTSYLQVVAAVIGLYFAPNTDIIYSSTNLFPFALLSIFSHFLNHDFRYVVWYCMPRYLNQCWYRNFSSSSWSSWWSSSSPSSSSSFSLFRSTPWGITLLIMSNIFKKHICSRVWEYYPSVQHTDEFFFSLINRWAMVKVTPLWH